MAKQDQPKLIELRFGNKTPQAPNLEGPAVTEVVFAPYVDDAEHTDLALSTDNDRTLLLMADTLDEKDRKWAIALSEMEQIIAAHSGGTAPSWIECSNKDLERILCKHFKCPTLDPRPTALFTNAGRDAMHGQHLGTAAQPAAFNYVGLTANSGAPAAADTTLTGEITTAGGGLIRAQATYAHTVGTNTSTLTKTFTANGSDALPVTVAKIGIFNAATVGTMAYETLLSATATFSASGDNLTITETVTAG